MNTSQEFYIYKSISEMKVKKKTSHKQRQRECDLQEILKKALRMEAMASDGN